MLPILDPATIFQSGLPTTAILGRFTRLVAEDEEETFPPLEEFVPNSYLSMRSGDLSRDSLRNTDDRPTA
jgi:hypothetical protein